MLKRYSTYERGSATSYPSLEVKTTVLALSATLAFSMRYDNEIPSTPALIDARPSAGLPRHVQPMMV